MAKAALSEDVFKPLLEKWGLELCTGFHVTLKAGVREYAAITIEKLLTQSEADDLTEALGDYYLVKRDES